MMPTDDELNEFSLKVYGRPFDELRHSELKSDIVILVLQAKQAADINVIANLLDRP